MASRYPISTISNHDVLWNIVDGCYKQYEVSAINDRSDLCKFMSDFARKVTIVFGNCHETFHHVNEISGNRLDWKYPMKALIKSQENYLSDEYMYALTAQSQKEQNTCKSWASKFFVTKKQPFSPIFCIILTYLTMKASWYIFST